MNNTLLTGRLVYEPELKVSKSGTNYLSTRIAVSRNDKDRTTDFFSFKAFGKAAEFITKYFHKGDPIGIVGKLQTDTYEKQDGTKVTEVYVFVSEVNFIEQKKADAPRAEEPAKPAPSSDMPFEI